MRVQRGLRELKSLKIRLAEFAAGVNKAAGEPSPNARNDVEEASSVGHRDPYRSLGEFSGIADAEVKLVRRVQRQAFNVKPMCF